MTDTRVFLDDFGNVIAHGKDVDLKELYSEISKPGYVSNKPTNPKDRAATHRIDLSLFPATAIVYGAMAMTEGDCKYGGYNYREKGVKASIYDAACDRHKNKWREGSWEDPKTRVPHLASALACLAILIDAHECHKLTDDRPPKTDMEDLMNRAEEVSKHLHNLFPNGPPRYTELKTEIK